MPNRLKPLVERLAGRRVLVLGDPILDEYLSGRATRLSREAPVPVLEFESRRLIPGGAANPAANVIALGSAAVQVGVVGADAEAATLREVLQGYGIDPGGLVVDASRPTTVKTRILAHMGLRFPQQLARLDKLSREPVSPQIEQQVLDTISQHVNSVDAVLLSDYRGGLLTASLVTAVRDIVIEADILLTADAQGKLEKYTGFVLVKCNAQEARDYLDRPLVINDDFAAAATELCERLNLRGGMVITRGPDGATLATCDGRITHCPSPSVTDVYDTVGAGDTAIAVITLAVAAGVSYVDAITLANYASGLVVRRVGNYTPEPDELTWALDNWTTQSSQGKS